MHLLHRRAVLLLLVGTTACTSSSASRPRAAERPAELDPQALPVAPAAEAAEPVVPEPSAAEPPPPRPPPPPPAPRPRVVTMDLDGDGRAEVAVGAPSHGQPMVRSLRSGVLMLHMSRTGRWSHLTAWGEPTLASDLGRDMTSGDIDGNGFDDLVVRHGGAFLVVHGGTDAEPRRARYPRDDHASIPWLTSGGDVHGDGYDDILALGDLVGETPPESLVLLYAGGRDGVARVAQRLSPPSEYRDFGRGVVLADLTGDGYADAAVQAYRRDNSAGYLECDVLIYEGGPQGLTAPPSVVRAPAEDAPPRGRDSQQDFGRRLYALRRGASVELFSAVWVSSLETAIGFAVGRDPSGNWTTRELLRARAGRIAPTTGDLDGDGFDEVVLFTGPSWEEASATVYFGATGQVRAHPLPVRVNDPYYSFMEVRQAPLGVDGPGILLGLRRRDGDQSVPEWLGVQTLRLVEGQFVLSTMQRARLPNRERPVEWGQFTLR